LTSGEKNPSQRRLKNSLNRCWLRSIINQRWPKKLRPEKSFGQCRQKITLADVGKKFSFD